MVFSSVVFVFLFLPVVITLYYGVNASFRNTLLLLASLVFYAWGEVFFVYVMLATIVANYVYGLAIGCFSRERARLAVLALAVATNLALLFSYKYANFMVDNLNLLLGVLGAPTINLEPVHLPIGISFFIFHSISYIVDIYRKDSPPQKNPLDLALYIALFPQLVAGPIIRYHDVSDQLQQRTHSVDLFLSGTNRFIIGLSKKVLIANTLSLPADKIFAIAPGQLSLPLAWLGIVCYSLQIYYDFSGYSDMAIGMGRMFGFQFKENFQWPYSSLSIREFWRRWHISLSTWFRDYLYIPLGGDRGGAARTHFNLLAVFFLCGLWHGASWTFVFWGFYHGAFLVLERNRFGRWLQRCPGILQRAYVILVFMLGWVFFRSETLSGALAYIGCMFNVFRFSVFEQPFQMYVNNLVIAAILWGICFSFPVVPAIRSLFVDRLGHGGGLGAALSRNGYALAMTAAVIVAFAASLSLLAAQTHNPFIYFRF